MRKNRSGYIKKLLLPCFLLSAAAGVFTAAIIFVFKVVSAAVISASGNIYAFVRENPAYLPLLIAGTAAVGLISALILRRAHDCRGGGIPTAVAALRGLVPLNWIRSILVIPISALLSFLCGIPLGNEGPCVQMGTAVGSGVVHLSGKKNKAWNRYIMTGGACAGFAVATGAPVTGILFAVEEAHRRFSPLLFIAASVSVVFGEITIRLLGELFGMNVDMFSVTVDTVLPIKYLWIPIAVGLVCGICAIFFTRVYRAVRKLLGGRLAGIPFTLKVVIIFAAVSVIGFLCADCIGSGHDLIESLLEGGGIRYVLLAVILVRALLLIFANNVGVTGGLFIPTLTFGAILGAICADTLAFFGIIDGKYCAIIVVVGMSAFLAASSRTPITACVFAIEVMCAPGNVLPVAIGVTIAYLVIEILGIEGFNETVIEAKIDAHRNGRRADVFDVHLTVNEGAFVVEKEIRDILWPPTCVVLSVEKNAKAANGVGLAAGDVLHVHYQSYAPGSTLEELEALVGVQDMNARMKVHTVSENHRVPEL